jgi:transposase-like protein
MATTTKPRRTLAQTMAKFATEDDCKAFLVERRWPNGVRCPRCDSEKVTKLVKRPWSWQCRQCTKNGYRFSPLVGTVFENTNYPLRTWFQVIFLMATSKKGISALQIHRTIGSGSYETAWYMCHRIRAAMKDGGFLGGLSGEIEVDETYIGGKDKNRHKGQRRGKPGAAGGKVPVIGAIARKGNVVCQILDRVTGNVMDDFVTKAVSSKVTLVATDEHSGYARLSQLGLPHETVSHSQGEYVRGNVHTANLDSFWSLLKRGIVGTFHNVSRDHLPLYLNEFSWRHNHRHDPDIFDAIIAGC